jgi:hypothetical protein
MIDTRLVGATRQNPVSFRPVFKAMLHNLVAWIVSGTAPPDPRYIEGTVDGEGKVHFATDADGNVKGACGSPICQPYCGTASVQAHPWACTGGSSRSI